MARSSRAVSAVRPADCEGLAADDHPNISRWRRSAATRGSDGAATSRKAPQSAPVSTNGDQRHNRFPPRYSGSLQRSRIHRFFAAKEEGC